jgi:hypothetical protein
VPKILLAGRDIRLLGTQSAVLARTGADVISCIGAKTVGMVKSERPDLVVLCHSLLSGNDAHSIADEIRACCKTTKILMVVSELESDLPLQDAKFDAICSSNPERLIGHANELLGTLPASCARREEGWAVDRKVRVERRLSDVSRVRATRLV